MANRTIYIALIDGTVWLRGSNGATFLSASTARGGISWSSKPPSADARTAVPISASLEVALRDCIKVRQQRAHEVRTAELAAKNLHTYRFHLSAAPHSAWVAQADLCPALVREIDRAIAAHNAAEAEIELRS